MRILVTGGAGFIGSHLTERLLAEGHAVTVVDDLSSGSSDNLADWLGHPRLNPHWVSIADRRQAQHLVDGVECVYHLAARVGVQHYVEDPLDVLLTNVHSTEAVLEAARAAGARVVFASTSEIYGKNAAVPFAEDADRVLGSTTLDRWCYSTAKAVDEHLCLAYRRFGLPVVILRYFNAYGPRALTNAYGGVVTRFVRQALAGEAITVYGDGSQSRSFTYVDDIVTGTLLAGDHPGAPGEVFNLGSEGEVTILQLAEMVRELAGSASPVIRIPYVDAYGDRYEDIPRRAPSVAKARQLLGYRPTVALADGIARTIRWQRQAARARV